jgi:hypothetical protein
MRQTQAHDGTNFESATTSAGNDFDGLVAGVYGVFPSPNQVST